jgi:hypothetical protein
VDIKSFVSKNGQCLIPDESFYDTYIDSEGKQRQRFKQGWGTNLLWVQDSKEIVKFAEVPVRILELCLIDAVNLYAHYYNSGLRFGVRNLVKGLARSLPEGVATVTDGRNTVTVASVLRF